VRFWDASAVVPLLVGQAAAPGVRSILQRDVVMVAWWGTDVECASALARLEREGRLDSSSVTQALARLDGLRNAWHEVLPSDAVREQARRVLRAHPIRAADALQLAAAVVASGQRPSTLPVVCLDERLGEAARREGFVVEPG
jgi:predicted nucleic acid-binding protein